MNGKTILEFYVYDVDSTTDNRGKTEVRLLGKTKEGKKVVVHDYSIKPYFFVVFDPKKTSEALRFLQKIDFGDNEKHILNLSVLKRNLIGTPVDVIKITVERQADISYLKNIVKEMPGYKEVVEIDIPLSKRYLVDKKIPPLGRIRVYGNSIESKKVDYEIIAEKIEVVEESCKGPMIVAIDIETYNPIGNPRPNLDPILMISIVGNNGYKRVITWKKFENAPEFVEIVESEMDLINRLNIVLKHLSPDIIVGYNSDNFDFPYIKARAEKYGIELKWGIDDSKLKIVRRGNYNSALVKGVPHVDLFLFIRNILAPSLDTEVYDLNSVAKELIGEEKVDGINWEKINEAWESGELNKVVRYSLRDSEITLKLAEKLLPLIFELTKLVGQTLFEVSRMTYGSCVEWYLIKNAHELGELIPNKPVGGFVGRSTYEGAYVHEPTPGLFKNIVVYDFRSLYPSIIVSHNICPTTIFCDCCKEGYKTPPINGKVYYFCKSKKGFIPTLIEDLISRRARIKEILKTIDKNEKDYAILNARSYALKTIANAMYGYFGFSRSRWYCIECAASITAWGRFYIKDVIQKAIERGFNVLYADTDSLFISLDSKTKEDANKFVEEINKNLPEMMELEFQGFYPSGLFVSAKKRYALADENNNIIVKGFEFVRRDWSKIAKETQMKVLRAILIDNSKEKALEIVKNTIKELKEGKMPLEKVIIYTQLTRNIEEYESIGPHVSAAIKARRIGYNFEPGQIIKYVVVKGEGSISDKSYIVEEVKEKNMEYDADYYINHQVIPAVERIFEVLGYTKDQLLGKEQTKLNGFF